MTDDMKARLRQLALESRVGGVLEQAADTLDARDAEIARLREALERIAQTGEDGASDQHAPYMWEACRTWACDALNGGDDEG